LPHLGLAKGLLQEAIRSGFHLGKDARLHQGLQALKQVNGLAQQLQNQLTPAKRH